MKIKLILIMIISLLCLQGCFGIGISAIGNRTATVQNPNISTNKGLLRESISEYERITSKELLDNWGPPDQIIKESIDKETWTYNFGRRWNGIGALIVIVPIPLIVPVGHNYIIFNIEKGKVASAFMKDDSGWTGAGCGFFPPHVMGCSASNCLGYHDPEIIFKFFERDYSKLLRELPKKK